MNHQQLDIKNKITKAFSELQLQDFNSYGIRKGHKILKECHNATTDLNDEQVFMYIFIQCLNQVLQNLVQYGKKPSECIGDSYIKFICGYFSYSYQTDASINNAIIKEEDSKHARFTESLIYYLLQGIESKEKIIRVKISQLLVSLINSIDELSDELCDQFKTKMLERLFDKEIHVRLYSIQALSRFQTVDESIIVSYLELLQHDPSADVRKMVLVHLELDERNLSYILERSRDIDVGVRRYLYKSKLIDVKMNALSIQHLKFLLKNGLSDREVTVKTACLELIFDHWIKQRENNLILLLNIFDMTDSEDLASDILKGYFQLVPNAFSNFSITFFQHLTVETSFIVRAYCQFVKNGNGDVSSLLPEIKQLVQSLEKFIADRSDHEGNTGNGNSNNGGGGSSSSFEFVLKQYLLMLGCLDYSGDEIGRRLVLSCLRNMFINPSVPDSLMDELIGCCKAALNQNGLDLSAFIYEVITDMKDIFGIFIEEDKIEEGLDSQSSVKVLASLRTIEIVKSLFRALDKSNPMMLSLLNAIVIPSINGSLFAFQLFGLECLGFACLLNLSLAIQYVPLLFEFVELPNMQLKVVALKFLFDLLTLHGTMLLDSIALSENNQNNKNPIGFLSSMLAQPSIEIQTVAVEGFAKLTLLNILKSVEILEGLLFLYFHPSTKSNTKLRQLMAQFIQAFSTSSSTNQVLIAKIFVSLVKSLEPILSSGENELDLISVAQQLMGWTDAQVLGSFNVPSQSENLHLEIAFNLVSDALNNNSPACLKLYSQILLKLRLDNRVPKAKVTRLLSSVGQLLKGAEKLTSNNLKKFAGSLVELESTCQEEETIRQSPPVPEGMVL